MTHIPHRRIGERRLMEATDLEKENLQAHVDLCEKRFQSMQDRLESVDCKVSEIYDEIIDKDKTFYKNKRIIKAALITGGATILASFMTTVVVVITTFL
jgi:peptidoglycan hydrolase CwlO-like protein